MMNLEKADVPAANGSQMTLTGADKWILSKVNTSGKRSNGESG